MTSDPTPKTAERPAPSRRKRDRNATAQQDRAFDPASKASPDARPRPPSSVTREESLDSKPIHNPALTIERGPDGCVTLSAPPRQAPWARFLARLLRVADQPRRIRLDELGTTVWDLCDSQTTVRQIITLFAGQYKLNRKEAEVSILQYIRSLAQKGLIGIMLPARAQRGHT